MTVKITISLPDDLAAEARAAVKAKQAASVSAYIATAMRTFADSYTWEHFMADMNAVDGPPSPEDYAWAREQLGTAGDE
jgi:metal-responsive CopG/Arc/MetJ family transcriptional regulator